jgi:hypothetical protein
MRSGCGETVSRAAGHANGTRLPNDVRPKAFGNNCSFDSDDPPLAGMTSVDAAGWFVL